MEDKVFMVGYAHIDLSWLWTRSETIVDIIPRTFWNAVRLIEKYGIRFSQSSAQLYKWIEEYYPDLFEKIRKLIGDGLWDVVGGAWCEYSPLLISGESIVRQHLYGKRYFMEKFGVDVKIAWLPDSFGFPWSMPQILKKSGINYFMTHKLKWQIHRNNPPIPFPYYIFWWQSPDGSKVLSYHTVGSYSEDVNKETIINHLKILKDKHGLSILMHIYGRGDHGGGPTEDMVLKAKNILDEGTINLKFARAEEFFKEVEESLRGGAALPTVNDELYVKTHRGTYTTEAVVKVHNRRCENLLINVEKLSVIANLFGVSYPSEDIRVLWEKLLLNQVHDNLDGTSIEQAYQDGILDYMKIKLEGKRLLNKALKAVTSKINTSSINRSLIVFNTLPWDRDDIVEIESQEDISLIDVDGNLMPIQRDSETGKLMFIARRVPGLGYKVFSVMEPREGRFKTDLMVNGLTLENSFVRVTVDKSTGNLISIYDKVNGAEVLNGAKGGNFLKIFVDKPPNAPGGEPAWNIYLGPSDDPETVSVDLIESGPVRSRVKITKRFGTSSFIMYVSLYAYMPRVNFEIRSFWNEEYRFAKIGFTPRFKPPYATYEIPYGVIQRYTHTFRWSPQVNLELPPRAWEEADMLKFEVAAQTWVDLSETDGSFGFTLLNDGRYGFSYDGETLWMSFLRAANRARPILPLDWTDRSYKPWVGEHVLKYALQPHKGTWREINPTRLGMEFNNPLIAVFEEAHSGELPTTYSFMEVTPGNIAVTAIKKCEDSDEIIVRIFESCGKECISKLIFGFNLHKAFETDLIEWDKYVEPAEYPVKNRVIEVPMKPFEIKTLKLKVCREET
jgi:alpha-mannosidase